MTNQVFWSKCEDLDIYKLINHDNFILSQQKSFCVNLILFIYFPHSKILEKNFMKNIENLIYLTIYKVSIIILS